MVILDDVRPRSARRAVALLGAGVLVGAGCTAGGLAAWHRPARATVVSGWAFPSADGTQIALGSSPESGGGRGYEIVGVPWSGEDGMWHGGDGPTCVGADTTKGTHVLLDVVNTQSAAGTLEQVVALRCVR